MEFLKALFGDGTLDYEQFSQAVSEKGIKLADLSTGDYVSKRKFDSEIKNREATILDLNGQITTRDTDIGNLKKQLEDGSLDNETKLSDLTSQISKLQGDYESVKNDYEARLTKQSYEFAVKEFANGLQFTSPAAKRDFIKEMISADLKMKNDSILGADDFVSEYTKENEQSFVVKEPEPTPEPPKPTFGQPTPPQPDVDLDPFNFNFMGVR